MTEKEAIKKINKLLTTNPNKNKFVYEISPLIEAVVKEVFANRGESIFTIQEIREKRLLGFFDHKAIRRLLLDKENKFDVYNLYTTGEKKVANYATNLKSINRFLKNRKINLRYEKFLTVTGEEKVL